MAPGGTAATPIARHALRCWPRLVGAVSPVPRSRSHCTGDVLRPWPADVDDRGWPRSRPGHGVRRWAASCRS